MSIIISTRKDYYMEKITEYKKVLTMKQVFMQNYKILDYKE